MRTEALTKSKKLPSLWQRAQRCPVCRKPGCLLAGSEPSAVVCRHVTSPEPIGSTGFLRVLQETVAWFAWRRSLQRLGCMEKP